MYSGLSNFMDWRQLRKYPPQYGLSFTPIIATDRGKKSFSNLELDIVENHLEKVITQVQDLLLSYFLKFILKLNEKFHLTYMFSDKYLSKRAFVMISNASSTFSPVLDEIST